MIAAIDTPAKKPPSSAPSGSVYGLIIAIGSCVSQSDSIGHLEAAHSTVRGSVGAAKYGCAYTPSIEPFSNGTISSYLMILKISHLP